MNNSEHSNRAIMRVDSFLQSLSNEGHQVIEQENKADISDTPDSPIDEMGIN